MAPRKRSRDIGDVDGEVEVEAASSTFRQTIPKRSRLSLAQENGGSVVSDDDEDELDTTPDEHDDNNWDAHDSESEEDEEIDELAATQIVQKQIRELRDNMASEQGVIEEVYCRNFMCHAKLRIKLGPLINFIIGHNGSGKSAVLTALTMCLGGKANATNRGGSLKKLIKEGEDSATLAVKIKNRGDGAYKPDIYGRSITVERHFTRAGTSGFKLKSENDKIISTKKADLDDILDFFAFQLDNPINVLTQDMARQFLSNSSPTEKYKFFIRGTQLEVLDADYKLMEEHLDSIEAKLFTRKQDIAVLKQKMDEAETRKRRLEQTASIQEKIARLQWQHAWAQVEEQERILEQYRSHVQSAVQRVQEKTDVAEAAEGEYEGHNQSFEAARNTLHEFQEQLRPLKEQHQAEKEKMDANKADLSEVLGQERNCKAEMRSMGKNIDRIEGDIKKEQDMLAGAEGTEHAEQLERLQDLKADVELARREQEEHTAGYTELQRKKSEALEAEKAGQGPFQQRKEALETAERTLNRTQQTETSQWASYRPRMEELVRAINRETRWRAKPVGPMGMHIRITKPEWTSPIERTMGGNMEAFIVTTKEDQTMLSQLMNKVNCKTGIFIGNASRLDTTGKEPTEDVDTMLRVLEIDNDLVRNSLIINQSAEQTVLIPDSREALRFMYSNPRPTNVKVTLAFASGRGSAIRYEYSGRGAEKSSNVQAWNGPARMKSDIEEQLRIQRDAVNQATREMDDARAEDRRLKQATKAAEAAIKRFDQQSRQFRARFQQAEDAVEEQQNLIDSNRPQDGKLQELERQLTEAKTELEGQQQSFQDIVNAKDEANRKAREIKVELDQATAERDAVLKRIDKAERRMESLTEARRRALQQKNEAFQLIDVAKQEQTGLEERLDGQQKQVDSFIEMAETISVRVEVDPELTADIIDQRIERLVKDRERAEREAGGTREELTLQWQQARQEHSNAEGQLNGLVKFAVELKATLTNRHFRWKMFRKYISARARITFMYLLSERSFRGRVLMNHSSKELDIKVEPDLSKTSDAGRATKTLSGGEKSFSTICLLLSIWEAMGSPIRCLDEFDVFMDNVNRATSMSMMIQAARRSVGRQFVLITPQSMNNVALGDDVRVHRMSDPERGQTALPYA